MNTRRVLHEWQAERSEIWRQNVLAWLNDVFPKELCPKLGKRRIEGLADALINLCRESREHGPTEEMNRWANRVNKLIKRYPSRKMVWWGPDHQLDFDIDFGPTLKGGRSLEASTAHSLWQLAEMDALEGLHRCICEKWFFARQLNQKSCSAICRHKIYEQTPAFKANRRAYMKTYRPLKASGKVK